MVIFSYLSYSHQIMSAPFLQIKPSRTKKAPPTAKMRFAGIVFLDLCFYFAHSSLLVIFYNDSVKLPSIMVKLLGLYPKLAKIDFTKIV